MKKIDIYLNEIYSKSLQNNYTIRSSSIHGNGVFATQDFKNGDFINFHFISKEKITRFGAHLNHSGNPTAYSKELPDGSYKTFAKKDIKKGDEITLDYTVNQCLEQPQKGWKMI